jgi:hypothetical protein
MAAMTDAFETALATLLFNNTTIANIGDATGLVGSTTAGSTQLSLHSSALSDASTSLATSELSYTGYTRQTQARSSAGWTIAGAVASNTALIQFGEMNAGGPVNAVHVGLGFIATGDVLRLHAATGATLVVNNGVSPQLAIGALQFTFA